MWQCPLCKSSLILSASGASCPNSHRFDRAKSGYLNLLPVQFKKSKSPGDDKVMLRARRHFHESNAYQPLKNRLVELSLQHLCSAVTTPVLLDAGCGEGSYLSHLIQAFQSQFAQVTAIGSDIAKEAVDLAAKKFKQPEFIVASSVNLPLADKTIDVVLQVFAPGAIGEMARIIKPSGIWISVEPGPRHLFELKQRMYDNPREHSVREETRSPFMLAEQQQCQFKLSFNSDEQRNALFTMTPFYWRMSQDAKLSLNELEWVTADFIIRVWKKPA